MDLWLTRAQGPPQYVPQGCWSTLPHSRASHHHQSHNAISEGKGRRESEDCSPRANLQVSISLQQMYDMFIMNAQQVFIMNVGTCTCKYVCEGPTVKSWHDCG